MAHEILPNLFRIEIPLPENPLKYVNSYVVKGSDRTLIIDTGLNRDECHQAMLDGLSELEVDPDSAWFFITHLHADHFGLVARLTDKPGRIYFSRPETEIIESWNGWEPMVQYAGQNGYPEEKLRAALHAHPGFKHSAGWVPDMNVISDGDVIDVGEYHFTCVHTPGHTHGHICLYEREKKLLVSGDHILGDITPNIQCWSDEDDPLGDYLESLDRTLELEVDLVLPGHRTLVTDMGARIAELKEHHRQRLDEVYGILEGGPKHAFDTASEMSWDITYKSWDDFPLAQQWFATAEATSHLRRLEVEGRISRSTDTGMSIYSLK